ncbi:hypothetical protein [Rhodococcus sp. IEGM 1307]|uniref:hypothetical protein n=1 Tax=Rhodococcus sp. IEGM 1307 TaxID=3047091 RepID=UPI0024B78358|nr:hypothetical protein [Rhodococcus sp. IEGM 1307]MDI9979820.1 hypothetical protein [Rhodococcus sp. IEGM 1307]
MTKSNPLVLHRSPPKRLSSRLNTSTMSLTQLNRVALHSISIARSSHSARVYLSRFFSEHSHAAKRFAVQRTILLAISG